MRIYTYAPGAIPKVIDSWKGAIPHREKYSPLAAGMYSELGGLNKWVHIWPYKDLNERNRIRAEDVVSTAENRGPAGGQFRHDLPCFPVFVRSLTH